MDLRNLPKYLAVLHLDKNWFIKSNHFGLRSSKDCYERPGGGVRIWTGSLGCEFLRGSMCAEGMGCRRRWIRCVLRGTVTASGHPVVSVHP